MPELSVQATWVCGQVHIGIFSLLNREMNKIHLIGICTYINFTSLSTYHRTMWWPTCFSPAGEPTYSTSHGTLGRWHPGKTFHTSWTTSRDLTRISCDFLEPNLQNKWCMKRPKWWVLLPPPDLAKFLQTSHSHNALLLQKGWTCSV